MKNIQISLLTLFIVFLIASCSNNKNEIENADKRLALIRELITNNKLNEAKAQIDSVHLLFPKLVDKRKVAVALKDTIILRESYEMLDYCQKALPELKKTYESLFSGFVFEKNEKYDETGKYICKTQVAEQNAGRNYLSVEVDENGDVFLVSHYSGAKINHSKLEVSVSGVTVLSDSTNAGVLHAFTDGSAFFENLTFKNEADGGIAGFIASNKNSAVKVTLAGTKRFTYLLSDKDKVAVADGFLIGKTKKAIAKAENDMRIAQQRIGKIKLLYN